MTQHNGPELHERVQATRPRRAVTWPGSSMTRDVQPRCRNASREHIEVHSSIVAARAHGCGRVVTCQMELSEADDCLLVWQTLTREGEAISETHHPVSAPRVCFG